MKFILPLVVAMIVVIGIIVGLRSSISSFNKESVSEKQFNTTSHSIHILKGEALAGTSSTKLISVPTEFNQVKIDFINSGSKPFTFTINQGTISGHAPMSGTVPADGGIHTFSSEEAWSTGEYYLNISSAQNMSGTVNVDLLK
ncbi:hypothetical protein [Paenibacillus sp. MER 99-2]|uniref:hypothetical protein n=1 Tax=Paenibacillus sp. MER 99-2 TaxID=2939572 RepID=UPI00204250FA|nr:hypothetical protein [Paenibacillus sp. MER 99-2]MCM3171673.1 hypothetical protein [Paenibacillus sp. MER 99-2]